ncbi:MULTISPECIES: acyltransferase family protein [Sphingobacterium]|uniref:Acyltransferase family protein n=1 Tax=Sphingobacterium populi TaxID=1812824 RepID=A0ABW5UD33_9SPHI|nr:acyltransferase [Sphingobacterium sp. CFCC 11742]
MNDLRLSRVIDGMRLPLVYLVVVAHLVPFTLVNVNLLPNNSNEFYVLLSEMFSHHLAKIPVRCYFLVSGYFFFKKFQGQLVDFGIKQIKSRFRLLIIPFFAWNIIMILAILFKNLVFLKLGRGLGEEYYYLTEMSLWRHLWSEPINFPLWYIRDLLCMMLVFPVILFFIKWSKHYGIVALGLLYVSMIESGVPGFSTTAIFFFSLGAYFSLQKKDILTFASSFKYSVAAIALVFLVVSLYKNGATDQEYYTRVFIIGGVISIINLFDYLESKDRLPQSFLGLSSLSFFIYVAHEVYIINWLKGFFYNLAIYENGWVKIASYFIIPIICIAICTLLFRLLQKFLPRFTTFILGGRLADYKYAKSDKATLEQQVLPVTPSRK